MVEYWRSDYKSKNDAARDLFEQVLKIDPNEAGALAGGSDLCD
jgi:hypothetical protein